MPDFFATLDQSMTPSYGSEPVVGAVYVLTGGRGLVNLRPDRRRSVHHIALSGSNDIDVSTADESCMVAYELKRWQENFFKVWGDSRSENQHILRNRLYLF